MKNLMVVVVMAVFFSILAAGLTLAAEQRPCPPGKSCSENYSIGTPQANTSAKPRLSPEEYQNAGKRDHDLTMIFDFISKSEHCRWGTIASDITAWVSMNPDVVVDKKDYLSAMYATSKNSSGCVATIVVHYHKQEK